MDVLATSKRIEVRLGLIGNKDVFFTDYRKKGLHDCLCRDMSRDVWLFDREWENRNEKLQI